VLLISYASCVCVKRVPLTLFVSVIILSEVRKIDTCTKVCSRLFIGSDGKGGTVDKGVLEHAEEEKIWTQKRWAWGKLYNEKLL
jgi:hypothetical protein